MLRVLVVEDEATAAEVMAAYVERVPAFEVAGLAASGADCLRLLGAGGIDLILLDIHLPDMSGLEVLRRIRAAGSTVDVIVVTQARDLSVVQAAVSFGSMQYLIKPFTFAAVRQKLERYQEYRSMLTENNLMLVQQEVDRLLHTMRDPVENDLPKGINPDSLQVVVSALRSRSRTGSRPAGCPRPRWPTRPARPGSRPGATWSTWSPRAWSCAARATAEPGVRRWSTGWCRGVCRANPSPDLTGRVHCAGPPPVPPSDHRDVAGTWRRQVARILEGDARSGPGSARVAPSGWSLASQLFAIQAAVILVVLVGCGIAAYSQASTANSAAAQDEVLGVAHAVAAAPTVRDGVAAADPSAVLQPFAEQVRRDTGTDFVVVMTTDGIRFTHPNPARDRPALPGHDRARAAGRVVDRDVHRDARAVGAGGRADPGGRAGPRAGRGGPVGQPGEPGTEPAAADPARHHGGRAAAGRAAAPGWPAGGCGAARTTSARPS